MHDFQQTANFCSKKVKFERFFAWPLYFLMQNNFHEFEELVFFDLWIPIPGSRIPDSGFRIPDPGSRIPDSGFRISDSGFRIPDSGFRIPDSGFWFPDSGCRFRIPVFDFRVLGLPMD